MPTASVKLHSSQLKFHPVTPRRWEDLARLFGPKGACSGCWCMWWKLPRKEFHQGRGERNKKALKKLVQKGVVPGILAYHKKEPIGWCAIEPRENYPLLDNSRTLARIDEEPVWSVTCFFVAKPFRKQGLSVKLLQAGTDYARRKGAKIVEGYPTDTSKGLPPPWVWTGLVPTFQRADFTEALRRSKSRPIMRYIFKDKSRQN